MARLTTNERNKLPNSAFAGPNRSFPINDAVHREKALQLVGRSVAASNISEKTADKIRRKAKRYRSIDQK